MVSRLSIVMIIVNMILGVLIPVVIMVSFKKKYKACIKSFLVGCVTMLLFAMVLEQLVHSVVLGPVSRSLQSWLRGCGDKKRIELPVK